MKKYSLLVATAFAALLASCTKTSNQAVVPDAPSGTFSGQFRLIHRKPSGTANDTMKKATIQLMMSSNGYTYKIVGDTSIHAGSYGTYAYDGTFIQFNDTTYPIVTVNMPGKPHLTGTYQYIYSNSIFQAVRTYSDTLSYQYDLKK